MRWRLRDTIYPGQPAVPGIEQHDTSMCDIASAAHRQTRVLDVHILPAPVLLNMQGIMTSCHPLHCTCCN